MINLEILILILLFVSSLLLTLFNTRFSIYILILLSVFLHKEVFSIYKWDILPIRVFMLAFSIYVLIYAVISIRRKEFLNQIKSSALDPFVFLLISLFIFRSISLINSKNLFSSISLLGFFGTVVVFGIYLYKKFSNAPDIILRYIKYYFGMLIILADFLLQSCRFWAFLYLSLKNSLINLCIF